MEDRLNRSESDALRLSRARFLFLAPIALLLLCDAAPSSRSPGVEHSAAVRGELDLPALERALEVINPGLDAFTQARIADAIRYYSAEYELDPALVAAVIQVESNGRPWVRSPKGAIGLMQVMPHMIEPMGLAGNAATIESNVAAGCRILAGNIERWGEEKGISAYFWGSKIRGVAYLEKVRRAREALRRSRPS